MPGGTGCWDSLRPVLRSKAREMDLPQIDVRHGDLAELDLAGDGFDAVVCVFGIFFVGDMVEGVRRL